MKIREFMPQDYDAVQKVLIEAEVFYEKRDSRENYEALTRQDPGSVLVAEVEGEIAGSIVGQRFGESLAILWSLAVATEYRRQGIAAALIESMEEKLRAKGVKEVWSFVDVANDASQALMAKAGFQTNTDHVYYGPHKDL